MSSNENIIKAKPKLTEWEVEWNGKQFNCQDCMGKGKCCGAENPNFNLTRACQKCRCQILYDTIDKSRSGKVSNVLRQECTDCDDTKFSMNTCKTWGMLENNLEESTIDCSNNFVNTGSNSTFSDIEQTTDCNIAGNQFGDVNQVDTTDDSSSGDTSSSSSKSGLNPNFIYIGVAVLVLILLLFLFF
jgi:hypothetical protein